MSFQPGADCKLALTQQKSQAFPFSLSFLLLFILVIKLKKKLASISAYFNIANNGLSSSTFFYYP